MGARLDSRSTTGELVVVRGLADLGAWLVL